MDKCARALDAAVKDLAMEHEIGLAAAQIGAVTGSAVNSLTGQKWQTEGELQAFMEKQGYKDKNTFRESVTKNIRWQRFMVYKAGQSGITVPPPGVLEILEEVTVGDIRTAVNRPDTGKQLRTAAAHPVQTCRLAYII